jgi:hypothetical protein
MKTLTLVGLAFLALAPLATATHDTGCVFTFADPASTNVIVSPLDGRTFYDEERGNPLGVPVPLSGFFIGPGPEPLAGQGTWLYEETNGLANLQRGGIGLTGSCFPADGDLCLLIDEDPIEDENCTHGRDAIIV